MRKFFGEGSQAYETKWNYTDKFCSSYIRNDMLCTIKNTFLDGSAVMVYTSILFGFNNINPKYITHMGTEDMQSIIDLDGTSETVHDESYILPDELINASGGYNEIGFEKIQNGVRIQPNYIVVCKSKGGLDTDIEKLQNATQAWGKKIPIVLVDVDKCLENEGEKVYDMISEFEKTSSLDKRELIIQKIRSNLLTARAYRTTFLEINGIDEIETKLDNILEKRKDLRKNLEWKCKGQSLLSTLDLESEAISIGLDFDDEIKKSTSKVKFDSELDKYVFSKDDAYSTNIPEDKAEILKQEAEELGLDFEEECDNAIARIMFRDDLKRMYDSKEEHEELSLEIMEEQCESLGLCWNYEVYGIYDKDELPISSDTKKNVENIARTGLSRNVQSTSTEIKEIYKELENPTHALEDNKSKDE